MKINYSKNSTDGHIVLTLSLDRFILIELHLLHRSGSSSEPSEQSFSLSQIHRLRMHRPFLHLNLSASHGLSAKREFKYSLKNALTRKKIKNYSLKCACRLLACYFFYLLVSYSSVNGCFSVIKIK